MNPRNSFVLLFLVLIALALAPALQAGASNKNGNPFGNGTFFPDSGVFSAILRSSNGFIGTTRFSTTSTNSTVTNSGLTTIYAEGVQFIGNAIGVMDAPSQSMSVTFSASGGGQVLVYNSTTAVYNTNTRTWDYYQGLTNFQVNNNLSGGFSAKINNSYPVQTFSGNGQTKVYITTVAGITNDTSGNTIIQTTNTSIPYVITVQGSRLQQQSF